MSERLANLLNALALVAISIVLLFAFYAQFAEGELPCPLCLLQRAGFVLVGVGLALNVILGVKPRHYGLMILGAVAGAIAALRQVALHVVPGTGGYGDPFLGLHFYTWAFVLFSVVVFGSAIMLVLGGFATAPARKLSGLGLVAVVLFAAMALGNGVSTLAECGLGLCPDNPVSYEALDSLLGR
ncbi:disulfide bond formation protein B [Martelella soudanensis]|uniref:disulfide bond formation protein B n=1 Tax=unclassified Martelella TaxID=2629616 RepID=UPI0015DE79EC|nr:MULTISPECIES: disulfide bond formation protein B [unclassified Martelella]